MISEHIDCKKALEAWIKIAEVWKVLKAYNSIWHLSFNIILDYLAFTLIYSLSSSKTLHLLILVIHSLALSKLLHLTATSTYVGDLRHSILTRYLILYRRTLSWGWGFTTFLFSNYPLRWTRIWTSSTSNRRWNLYYLFSLNYVIAAIYPV